MKKNLNKLNLFLELFQKGQIPNCYLEIKNRGENILKNNIKDEKKNSLVHSHSLCPNYLEYLVNEDVYKLTKVKQANKGYAIDISEIKNIQAYMESHMSRSFRKAIRQSVRRLEDGFKISYRMLGHNILESDYISLFDQLREMLDKRFEQKNEKDEKLSQWLQIKNDFYESLKNKKANIFVIYNADIPISISLNYLSNNMIFCWISSYNTDYGRFSLGHVDLYKHVEWCFENNYGLIELGYGDHDYKSKWSNIVYNFEHHVLSKRNSFSGFILGKIEYGKVYLKEFLKHKGVVVFLKSLKKSN
ncbi:GNAT family N-acetyltransferase [Algibacter sp. AS12]|uniref:GNAT family N-acetyltransferase n=1 Tax=Algibacter sp. AS12 TaxID=3135773 RepID=UPI00398AC8B7